MSKGICESCEDYERLVVEHVPYMEYGRNIYYRVCRHCFDSLLVSYSKNEILAATKAKKESRSLKTFLNEAKQGSKT